MKCVQMKLISSLKWKTICRVCTTYEVLFDTEIDHFDRSTDRSYKERSNAVSKHRTDLRVFYQTLFGRVISEFPL